jgi:hypothetical protein
MLPNDTIFLFAALGPQYKDTKEFDKQCPFGVTCI